MKAFDSCSAKADFDQLRHSRRVNGEALWLRLATDSTLERPRIAFSINTHYGKATQRNRLRRRLVAALTEIADRTGDGTGGRTDGRLALGRYLIGTRSSVAKTGGVSYRTVLSDLEAMLAKIQNGASKQTSAVNAEVSQ